MKFKSLHWFIKFSLFFFICVLILGILSMLNRILPTKIVSNVEMRGLLFQNQIWDGEIRITGDLYALPSTVITIKPGTRISIARVNDKNNYDLLPWHLKNGINTGLMDHGVTNGEPYWDEREKIQVRLWKVKASGEKEQPITISSDNPVGNIYDVNLIRIEEGELEYVKFSNYRRLEIGQNVLIKNSNFENTGECAACITRGTPSVEQNIFKNGKRSFIEVGLAAPYIKGNSFLESKGNGVVYYGVSQSEVRLIGNIFEIPNKKAISVQNSNIGGLVLQNSFDLGNIEIPCNSKVKIEANTIKGKIYFKNPESCSGVFIIGENFWNTTDLDSVKNTRFVGVGNNFKVEVPKILPKSPL